MQRCLTFLLPLVLLFSACKPTSTPSPSAIPTEQKLKTASLVAPSATLKPSETHTPAETLAPEPTALPEPSPTPGLELSTEAGIQTAMSELTEQANFPPAGLPDDTAARWLAFSEERTGLTADELRSAAAFLESWLLLNDILALSELDNKEELQIRVITSESGQGDAVLSPYLVLDEDGAHQYYLLARDEDGKVVDLMPAPEIPGLSVQIHADGQLVAYLDERGRTMLLADAYKLDEVEVEELEEDIRADKVEDVDPFTFFLVMSNLTNRKISNTIFPRYKVNVLGIEAYFYGLEYSITDNQIVLLNESFELFTRPEFIAFQGGFFGPDVSVFIVDELGRALGITYTGTGVVMVDRTQLFGNRYELAEVLAHEGSHVQQRNFSRGSNICSTLLQMEIGDRSIPEDFYSWTAEQVVNGIKTRRLGAYHVSLWMMNKLGVGELDIIREVIRTGAYRGQSILLDCP